MNKKYVLNMSRLSKLGWLGSRRPHKKNKNKNKNKKAPFVSTQAQRYGPGFASACCNGLYTMNTSDNSIVAVSLPSVALGSPEYPLYGSMYKWYKLKRIAITFLPLNYIDVDSGVFFQVQWKRMTDLEDTANIELDDNSKYVGSNILQPTTFIFKPPKAVITTFQNTSYNFKDWMPASSSAQNWPISLYYKKRGLATTDWTINVQFFIDFRGSNLINLDALKIEKIFKMKNEIKHLKIKNSNMEVTNMEPSEANISKIKERKEKEEKEKEKKEEQFYEELISE